MDPEEGPYHSDDQLRNQNLSELSIQLNNIPLKDVLAASPGEVVDLLYEMEYDFENMEPQQITVILATVAGLTELQDKLPEEQQEKLQQVVQLVFERGEEYVDRLESPGEPPLETP